MQPRHYSPALLRLPDANCNQRNKQNRCLSEMLSTDPRKLMSFRSISMESRVASSIFFWCSCATIVTRVVSEIVSTQYCLGIPKYCQIATETPTVMALTHNLQLFASQISRLLLYIDIDTDSPPAKEYKSIDGLLALGGILCCRLHARSARCLQGPSHGHELSLQRASVLVLKTIRKTKHRVVSSV
jgi:hypothetical protein